MNFLKEKGIYDLMSKKLKEAGKADAIAFCSPYLTLVVFASAVDGLCKILNI